MVTPNENQFKIVNKQPALLPTNTLNLSADSQRLHIKNKQKISMPY